MKKFIYLLALFAIGLAMSCKKDAPDFPPETQAKKLDNGFTKDQIKKYFSDLANGITQKTEVVIHYDTARTDYYDTISHPGLKLNYYWEYWGVQGLCYGYFILHKDTMYASTSWILSGQGRTGFMIMHEPTVDAKTLAPPPPTDNYNTPYYSYVPHEKLGTWLYIKIYDHDNRKKLIAKDSVYVKNMEMAVFAPYNFDILYNNHEPDPDNISFSFH